MSLCLLAQESPHGIIRDQCTNCHSTNGWLVLTNPMIFDHNSTSFILYGQHRNTDCRNCHRNLKFAGTPRTCSSCHKKEYDDAITLNHMSAGFSTDCLLCHSNSASSWQGSFDHNRTEFPTRGAHEAVACNVCHTNQQFRGISMRCISCHEKEYIATSDPAHTTAGFSPECAECHRALTWKPAAFYPHPQFPINAGAKHSPGVWNSCNDCHIVKMNYHTFECIDCHHHEKSSTDSNHSGRKGYVYQSSACYRCHPQG